MKASHLNTSHISQYFTYLYIFSPAFQEHKIIFMSKMQNSLAPYIHHEMLLTLRQILEQWAPALLSLFCPHRWLTPFKFALQSSLPAFTTIFLYRVLRKSSYDATEYFRRKCVCTSHTAVRASPQLHFYNCVPSCQVGSVSQRRGTPNLLTWTITPTPTVYVQLPPLAGAARWAFTAPQEA